MGCSGVQFGNHYFKAQSLISQEGNSKCIAKRANRLKKRGGDCLHTHEPDPFMGVFCTSFCTFFAQWQVQFLWGNIRGQQGLAVVRGQCLPEGLRNQASLNGPSSPRDTQVLAAGIVTGLRTALLTGASLCARRKGYNKSQGIFFCPAVVMCPERLVFTTYFYGLPVLYA